MRHRQDVLARSQPRRAVALVGVLALAVSLVPAATDVAAAQEAPQPQVTQLMTDALAEPLGIDGDAPRLSWQLEADRRGVTQTAYQVRVASTSDRLDEPDVWDSGQVTSDQQVDVAYGGPDLASRTRYHWQVRVWDDTGTPSEWSDPAWFETGMLSADDWTADWIGGTDPDRIGEEWTDYTVRFTASDIDGALGVYLRGRDDDHAYMWQLSEAEGSLRPHVKDGGYRVLPSAPFPDGFDPAAAHEYEITVAGDTITTSIDGEVLDERTDTTHLQPGVMGFRTSGPERGLVHDLTVTSADGTTLVDTDFTRDEGLFRAGRVTDDGLLVDGNAEAWLTRPDPVPVLRHEFDTRDGEIVAARVYAAARGVYELELNGEPVGDHELAPGWTDYRARIQHQTYDVTDQLRAGANVLGGEVADGWYAGNVAMFNDGHYGDDTSLIAELHVTYADGTTQVIATDGDWSTTGGPRTAADILDGETYDARRAAELAGWSEPGFDASGWADAVVRDEPTAPLEPQTDQPVRVTEELDATYLSSPDEDTHIYDLGQNMVGKVRVTVQGEAGDQIRLRHAEVLNPDGTMYVANLRRAGMATDRYILATDQPETYAPEFTFHGFRYVEVSGVAEPPDAADIVGVVMGTDGPLVSELDTSSEMVDQLHSNIVWGMRGNFLSIPTDTPARDERMGWTGDINVFARTAVYNMDSQAFLTKWLEDLRDTQRDDGALPGVAPVVPDVFDGGYGRAGWADAGVNVPWTLWQAYGDTAVIRENYDMMTRFVDYLEASSGANGIRNVGGYDDWLNLDDPTPTPVIDTAFVAKSARQLAQMAAVIGEDADAARYQQLYEDVRAAYIDEFIADDGTVHGDSQTAYILTITNGLVPDDRRDEVADRFIETIERRDWHLSTGFLGVDGLLPALTEIGRTDVAYRLLQNTDYPSWGYEIERGATTIWERWNSIMPDGSFGPVSMNSFNHYAYGAVGEWMYRTMAGVSALEPGYRSILIAPEPGEGIDHVDLSHETRYGTVRSAWERDGEELRLEVEIPAGTTATVRVPAPSRWAVTEGGVPAEDADHVDVVEVDGEDVVLTIASGTYTFAVDPVLGAIGEAREAIGELQDLVDELDADGRLHRGAAKHLTTHLDKLAREVGGAWATHLEGGDAIEDVHRALSTVASLTRWLETQVDAGRIDAEVAAPIGTALAAVDGWLSDASSALIGAVLRLDLPAEAVAGDTFRAGVVLENTGSRTLEGLTTTLLSADGWSVRPVGDRATTVAPGTTAVHEYDVTVPVDQDAGTSTLEATIAYRHRGGVASHAIDGEVLVAPAVAIDAVTVDPDRARPGGTAQVEAELRNRSTAAAAETLKFDVPDGWSAPEPVEVTLDAGETTTVTAPLEVPLEVTSGDAVVTAATGPSVAERRATTLEVVFDDPPAIVFDHVDLGVPASEEAHDLSASPASGTSFEAGLTRRYSNAAVPGGWFEFDLEVPAGEPFLLRAVETYDGPQTKDYEVLIDGEVVHARTHRRSDGGHGTVTYQFVVDAPEATADGVVRVRYADTGDGYDPSIADVWATPVRGGLDGPDLADGASVTARSSLEGGDWGVANLVDGARRSVGGGAKGYTSDPPRTSTDAVEWLVLDLGEAHELDTVVLFPRTETTDDTPGDGTNGAHFPRDFRIEVSDDGDTWTTVHEATDVAHPGSTPQAFGFDAVTARFVRVHVTELGQPTVEEGDRGFHRLQLAEIDVLNRG